MKEEQRNQIEEVLKELAMVLVKRDPPLAVTIALSAVGGLFQNMLTEHKVDPKQIDQWVTQVKEGMTS